MTFGFQYLGQGIPVQLF